MAAISPAGRGVIFDLDGTLADTPAMIASIIVSVLAERGVVVDDAGAKSTVGRPVDDALARFLGLPAAHPDVVAALGEYRRRFGDQAREAGSALLFPGVTGGLRALSGSGRRLGIATSKIQAAGVAMVKLLDIADLFDTVAGDDTVTRGKPHPDMALYVADQLGLAPADCVVVGDAVADMEMGLVAGMSVIGVSYGVATRAELRAAGAGAVVDSFADLVPAILAGAP